MLTEKSLVSEDLIELVKTYKTEIECLKRDNLALEMEIKTLKWLDFI
jgi:hypothetical protein